MNILKGDEKQQMIDLLVDQHIERIVRDRPASISTQTMDYQVRNALLNELAARLIFAEWDGKRIKLLYIPEE